MKKIVVLIEDEVYEKLTNMLAWGSRSRLLGKVISQFVAAYENRPSELGEFLFTKKENEDATGRPEEEHKGHEHGGAS